MGEEMCERCIFHISSGWRGDRVACFFSSHIYVKGILGEFGTSNLGEFSTLWGLLEGETALRVNSRAIESKVRLRGPLNRE